MNAQASHSSQTASTQMYPQAASFEPSQPSRRGRSRRTFTTRFRGFDSDDDTPANLLPIPESMVIDNSPAVESQSQGLFVTQDPEMDLYRAPSPQPETQTSSRKRHLNRIDNDLADEKDIMEEIAPAATALKRRRLAEIAAGRRERELTPPSPQSPPPPENKILPKAHLSKKIKKEIDVVEVARLQREHAEELARAEREVLQEKLDGMDIEAIRNLAIVEDMEVTRPNRPVRAARADESDRWDDRWNGRKNFKKFRRRGAGSGRKELGRVIVPLEEAKKKDYGIGDDYWLESDSHNRKKKGKPRDTQDLSQLQSQSSRPQNWASTRAAAILAQDIDDGLLETEAQAVDPPSSPFESLDAPPPKTAISSRSQRSQNLVDKTNAMQNISPRKKRVASATLTKPAPVKKVKPTVEIQDSDDSEDELKFRFRKKR